MESTNDKGGKIWESSEALQEGRKDEREPTPSKAIRGSLGVVLELSPHHGQELDADSECKEKPNPGVESFTYIHSMRDPCVEPCTLQYE